MSVEVVTHTSLAIVPQIIGNRIVASPQDLAAVARRVSGEELPSTGTIDILIADESENGSLFQTLDDTAHSTGYFLRRGQQNPIVALVDKPQTQAQLEERHLTQALANHYAARRYQVRTRNVGRAALYGGMLSSVAGIASLATEHYTAAHASLAGVAAAMGMARWFGERRGRINRGRTPTFKDIGSIEDCRPLRIIPDELP